MLLYGEIESIMSKDFSLKGCATTLCFIPIKNQFPLLVLSSFLKTNQKNGGRQ